MNLTAMNSLVKEFYGKYRDEMPPDVKAAYDAAENNAARVQASQDGLDTEKTLGSQAAQQGAGQPPQVRYYASVALRNPDGRYLTVHHTRKSDHPWRFPGGKINAGERPDEAVIREAQEELGVELNDVQLIDQQTTFVDGSYWTGFYFLCTSWKGLIRIQEPEKQTCTAWLTAEQLASPGVNAFPEQLVAAKIERQRDAQRDEVIARRDYAQKKAVRIEQLEKFVNELSDSLSKLVTAVHGVYYAAHWSSDRLDKDAEQKLWEGVRDAAGFATGLSPKREVANTGVNPNPMGWGADQGRKDTTGLTAWCGGEKLGDFPDYKSAVEAMNEHKRRYKYCKPFYRPTERPNPVPQADGSGM